MARELTDNLKHGVSSGCFALDLDGEDAKQQNLHGCTGSIPACAHDIPCLKQTCDGDNNYSSLSCAINSAARWDTWYDCLILAGSPESSKEARNRANSPEGSRDSVLIGNVTGLQECCRPCPCASQNRWSGT